MKRTLTFVFSFIVSVSYSQTGWRSLAIPLTTRYDDLYFLNADTAYTAGGWNGLVHKTVDAGQTWTESRSFGKYLRSIQFLDDTVGLCGSLDSSLYRTTDGGATWTDIASSITPHPPGICGLARADENTIYGVGIWSEPAFVIKSTDKGATWTTIDMSMYASSLIDAFFFDADHGFVAGSVSEEEGGVILYTEDGGAHWVEKIRTGHASDRIWKIQTPDRKHFFGSVESFSGDKTRFLRSSDAGKTWEMKDVRDSYYYIQSIGFIDSLRGWTGGNENFFETSDGGNTWVRANLGKNYNRFVKVDEKTAYLTGSRVYQFTRENIITGIPDQETGEDIHTIIISPNPTTAKANIHVNFGTKTMAHVYLYNTEGKNLKRIFDSAVAKGETIIPIDLSNHSPQTIVVIVKTNEGMISAKLVKE
jgi:photosystem II stability/assembly factor-like uncharacterized protein